MGDDKCCAVLCQCIQRILDDLFTLVIQRTGSLIKNKDRRVFQEDARDAQPLLLPTRTLHAALPDVRVITVPQRGDEVMCVGPLRRFDDLCCAGTGSPILDVLEYGPGKQIYICGLRGERSALRSVWE